MSVPGPDGKMDQFAHSSVIMVATPDGRLSKYFSGIQYQPRDLRLAMVDASNHKIGSGGGSVSALLLQLQPLFRTLYSFYSASTGLRRLLHNP